MSIQLGKALKNIAVGGVLAASATAVYAANDGTAGATSEGDLDISLTILQEVKISNLSNIVFPAFTGADLQDTSPACIYHNTGTGYTIQADGDGNGGNEFYINTGTGTTDIPYTVAWDDGSGYSAMTAGAPLGGQSNARGIDDDCATGGDNASVQVTITAANAAAAGAGAYTGLLTLTVAPF